MSWEKVKLGDVAEFSNGINFGKEAYAKGIKLIGVSNFGNRFYPDYNELEEVCEDVVRDRDCLKSGDIVFVRSNGNKELVGRCMLIENPPAKVTFSGFCIRARLKDLDNQNPIFWSYHFKNQGFRKAMAGTAIGANIQNLSQGRLAAYEAEIPDINTQNAIARILLKYDDFIENSQKQIKLLEEVAQRLYKEWFVDLRFPEYEEVEIVDGVPEGWHKGTINEIAVFKRGKTITKAQIIDGIVPVVAGGLQPAYYHNQANTKAPVITISGSGANAGFARLYNVDVFASDCSFADIETTPYVYFTFNFLKANKASLEALQKGAAQPHVYAKDINMMDALIPSDEILRLFTDYTENYFLKIEALEEQINVAQQARNRLLPKLMNGEIEV